MNTITQQRLEEAKDLYEVLNILETCEIPVISYTIDKIQQKPKNKKKVKKCQKIYETFEDEGYDPIRRKKL